MKKEGYSETTVERYVRLLKRLSGCIDLNDPESVKAALTRTGWSEATKEMACGAYALYAKQHGFTFVPPRYRRVEKLPFIPLESEVEQLIAAMRLRTSTFLSLLKDTGARPLEAWKLKWKDIDFANSTKSSLRPTSMTTRVFGIYSSGAKPSALLVHPVVEPLHK